MCWGAQTAKLNKARQSTLQGLQQSAVPGCAAGAGTSSCHTGWLGWWKAPTAGAPTTEAHRVCAARPAAVAHAWLLPYTTTRLQGLWDTLSSLPVRLSELVGVGVGLSGACGRCGGGLRFWLLITTVLCVMLVFWLLLWHAELLVPCTVASGAVCCWLSVRGA